MIVVDTNTIIGYHNRHFKPEGQERLRLVFSTKNYALSIVSRMEVLVGIEKDENRDEVENFLKQATVIDIWPEIETETIRIRRAYKLKLPDAIIAATAVFLDATIANNDKIGFGKVPGLAIWVPERT